MLVQVGQRVTARPPVTRQLHDGDILTTGGSFLRCALSHAAGYKCKSSM